MSTATVVFRAFPHDAHHHGNDDGDLYGANDGGDEDVVELLAAGHHIQDVEVLGLLALCPLVARVTPAGGHVVLDLAFPVYTEASVALRTGDVHPGVEAIPWVCGV